jgi:hypothetical protein
MVRTTLAATLETRMLARDLGPSMEHDAEDVLGRVEAGDVAVVGEGGRLPLDGLGDAAVCPEDDVSGVPHRRVEGVVGLIEPLVHFGVPVHGRSSTSVPAHRASSERSLHA